MPQIHPTAIVAPAARVAGDVVIGPYCVIGGDVELGAGVRLAAHVVIDGRTAIGDGTRIFPFASIGLEPQDLKYQGEASSLIIGRDNTIREYVTINRGTVQDGGLTSVGDDNWIMACVHFAHDCRVGSHAIFANATALAGHVIVGDWAVFGGVTLVHQFVRIGAHAHTGMGAYLAQDLPPFVTAAGNMAKPYGINSKGLQRRGFSAESIEGLKRAYRTLYRKGLTLEEAKQELETQAVACPPVRELVDFLANCKRGFIR